MNRFKKGILLILIGISTYLIFHFSWRPECIFKKITSLPCPGCGLTRGFEAILKGNILSSFSYNILSFPLFLMLVVFILLLLYDFFTNKNILFEFMNRMFTKYYKIIFMLLGISWIVNFYRGI